jgi:DNA polymerase I-like protein with 3'-5' exonuclease and polymerase domains
MLDVFEGQELHLPPILAAMENVGISVDLDKLTANRAELQQRIALLEQRCPPLPCLAQHVCSCEP